MSLVTDLQAIRATLSADKTIMDKIVNGPASGANSIVTLSDNVTTVKTMARVASEIAVLSSQQAVYETVQHVTIAAGAVTLNVAQSGIFTMNLTSNVAITVTGAPANLATSIMLEITADGTSRTITYTGNVTNSFGYTPSFTAGKKDRIVFDTLDGGSSYHIWPVGSNF